MNSANINSSMPHEEQIKLLLKTIEKLNGDNSCSVCMENIPQNKMVTTRCNHHFCNDCFWKWCEKNNTCPNCRADLMDKNREQELNMKNLLERQDEIIERVQEYYEEEDKLKRSIEEKWAMHDKLQDDYIQLQNELGELQDEACEIHAYKRNPKKAMKMLDKRLKKRGLRIYEEQKIKKKIVLNQLLHGNDYESETKSNGYDDFSDGFNMFDTEETGHYCTSIKCNCDVCSLDWSQLSDIRDASGELPVCRVIKAVRDEWQKENGYYNYDLEDGEIDEYGNMPDLEEFETSETSEDVDDIDEYEYELEYIRGNYNLDVLAGVTIEASV